MFDLIVLAIILGSAAVGFLRGAAREVVAVVAFISAIVAAVFSMRYTTPFAQELVATEWIARALALLVVGLAVYIVLRLLGGAIVRQIRGVGPLSTLDRVIGVGFGLIRALVVLGLFNIVFHMATPPERTPKWVLDAKAYPLTLASARALKAAAPKGEALADKVAPALSREWKKSSGRDDSTRDKAGDPSYDAATRKNLDILLEQSR